MASIPRRAAVVAALALLQVSSSFGSPAAGSPFVAVFVDRKTEERLGPFPYDRKVYADALRELRRRGARAVVVKFFLDQPKSEEGDAALEAELRLLPVFLQARLDDSEAVSNPFPARFALRNASGNFDRCLSGANGWLPLPRFADAARGVGFVDFRDPDDAARVPVVLRYRDEVVPALVLSVAQFEIGGRLQLVGGKSVSVGGKTVPLDAGNEVVVPLADAPGALSLADLLAGAVPAERLRGKVVILGYDGDKQDTFSTPIGSLRAHRLFFHTLLGFHGMLKPGP